MGVDYSIAHAAVLASQLPPHSRCAIKANPDAAWSDERAVLERIDYDVRYLAWMFSKDGAKGLNPPKPPKTPAQLKALGDQIQEAKDSRAELDRLFGIPSA